MKKLFMSLFFFLLCLTQYAFSQNISIGVQVAQNPSLTKEEWRKFADYLHAKIPEYEFNITTLNAKELLDAGVKRRFDYIIANPQIYVTLEELAGAMRMVTMSNYDPKTGYEVAKLGGVIIAMADRNDIQTLKDVGGKKIASGYTKGVATYLLQLETLSSAGVEISPKDVSFLETTQDKVVESILKKQYDVGFIRTGVLEKMIKENKFDISKIKIINPRNEPQFFQLLSTELIPEWAMMAMSNKNMDLSERIVSVLLMADKIGAAKKSEFNGVIFNWTIPQDYNPIRVLMKKHHIAPFDKNEISLEEIIQKYLLQILIVVTLVIGILTLLIIYLIKNIDQRKLLESKLNKRKEVLEQTVEVRTEELELQKEKFETFYKASKDGIAILDLESNFLDFNDAYLEMTGFTREELMTKSCIGLSAPEYLDSAIKTMQEVLAKGFVKNFEKVCIVAGGRRVSVSMTAAVLPDKKSVLLSVKDITEKMQLEENLRSINKHLQEMVKEETEKRVEKEKLLIQQSKMAVMGEMIGAIAHQWRQPLNSLGMTVQDVEVAYKFGEVNEEYLANFKKESMSIIQTMSSTIDDFRNFFSNTKKQEEFYVEDAINDVLKMLSAQFKLNSIDVIFGNESGGRHKYICYKNELKQVVLNILANAKDALVEHKREESFIKINVDQNDANLTISIEDSAGGIPEGIMDKIFDSHFTTKAEGKGTGIGLYMSKQIVESSLHGKLVVSNTESGARFVVMLSVD
jgi:PAS domain S-box-containing protein